jgi:hypothetical protein
MRAVIDRAYSESFGGFTQTARLCEILLEASSSGLVTG